MSSNDAFLKLAASARQAINSMENNMQNKSVKVYTIIYSPGTDKVPFDLTEEQFRNWAYQYYSGTDICDNNQVPHDYDIFMAEGTIEAEGYLYKKNA